MSVRAATDMLVLAMAVALMLMCSSTAVEATLEYDFYSSSCPQVENLVYQEISKAYWNDSTVAPGILRISFHDCFNQVRLLVSLINIFHLLEPP